MASNLPVSVTMMLFSLVFSLTLFVLCVGECPEGSPILDDKVSGSDVVIQGQIQRQHKVNREDRSYTAEVRVLCIYKGGPLLSLINVTGAGTKEGRCVRTHLPRGSVSLIYLRHTGSDYTPTFTQDPAQRKYLDELKYVCGLHVQLPSDSGAASSPYCKPAQFHDYDAGCSDSDSLPLSTAPSSDGSQLQGHYLYTTTVIIVTAILSAFLLPPDS